MPAIQIQPMQAVTYTVDGRLVLIDPRNPRCRATCTTPKWNLLKDLKEPLALDIEFQEFKPKDAAKWGHRIGRIAFVNSRGQTIYDTYVRYDFDANVSVKTPPEVFGVTRSDLQIMNGAQPIFEVEQNLKKIMYSRTIVGHGMRLDIGAIDQKLWEDVTVVDTQHSYGQVKLSKLSATYLSEDIQEEMHDPTEDARATMLLYLRLHPFQGRSDFKDAPFKFEVDEFPALGAPTKKKK